MKRQAFPGPGNGVSSSRPEMVASRVVDQVAAEDVGVDAVAVAVVAEADLNRFLPRKGV